MEVKFIAVTLRGFCSSMVLAFKTTYQAEPVIYLFPSSMSAKDEMK